MNAEQGRLVIVEASHAALTLRQVLDHPESLPDITVSQLRPFLRRAIKAFRTERLPRAAWVEWPRWATPEDRIAQWESLYQESTGR